MKNQQSGRMKGNLGNQHLKKCNSQYNNKFTLKPFAGLTYFVSIFNEIGKIKLSRKLYYKPKKINIFNYQNQNSCKVEESLINNE